MDPLQRENSRNIFEKSQRIIPGGVNSPVRSFQGVGIAPLVVHHGKGAYLWDVDDNVFVDFCQSWGALILGHAFPSVVEAVQRQMTLGSSYGAITELEWLLASSIQKHMPSMEKIRFVSSGTEATMSALRLARGVTGKNKLVKCNGNYHGHADPFLVRAGSGVHFLPSSHSLGVPTEITKNTLSIPYNDPGAVERVFAEHTDIAAVIVEPIAANMGVVPASSAFLSALRKKTAQAGALLIFDEVVSGFRVGLGGAQGLYGIYPDLTCLGKIIGGGLPVGAFGGKKEIMDCLAPLGGVYQAGTLSGNPLAMAAGIATLEEVERNGFYIALENKARGFFSKIEPILSSYSISLQRVGSLFTLFFGVEKIEKDADLEWLDNKRFQSFYKKVFSHGVYLSPAQQEASFIGASHTEESLARAQEALWEAITNSY